MNKNSTTIGLDLGDKYGQLHVLNADGEVLEESKVRMTPKALKKKFDSFEPARIAIEAGTHSPWVNRTLIESGHEVLVANPRKLRMIYSNDRKSDKLDAEMLARVARFDPELLVPICHRSEKAQKDLGVLHARDALVRARTMLINQVRGMMKSCGHRPAASSTPSFHRHVTKKIPDDLRPALEPILETIGSLTGTIRTYDRQIETMCQEKYPQTRVLRSVNGVGALTAMAYVLTLDDSHRFGKSRDVGCYLGLVPRRNQSGESDPQLRITKAGNRYLRRLLVSAAHYILGPFGADSELRRWGSELAESGGKKGKKRAVVAVARKLAVLLHRLWITNEEYQPFYSVNRAATADGDGVL